MSAHAHETMDPASVGPMDPAALEAAPKAWYDDLKIDQVVVAAFVSTVLSLAAIFFAQGLYASLVNIEIDSKDRRSLVSPGQALINGQNEMLETAAAPQVLTAKLDADRYYAELPNVELRSIEDGKAAALAAYGNQGSDSE
ncbi:MAG: hypothetical protein R3B96_00110 [Pirellulaceae bacterium]|nr:hypothetical protein [Planctomycetales bacterium]